MIIKPFKALLHAINVMSLVVTYVEVIFFQYHMFIFIAIWPMSITNMDHFAHLL